MAFEYEVQWYLRQITVNISPVEDVGTTWTTDEIGEVDVEVINTCGVPLRDVIMVVMISGPARRSYWGYWGINLKEEFEPNQSTTFKCTVIPTGPGTVSFTVKIFAEVVPYGYREMGYREVEVFQE